MVGGHADEAYHDISPVEKVIGICTFLLTFEGVDPSNIFSRIGFGRYENFNLLFVANASFTKLWDDQASQPILSSLIRQAHCSYAGCLIGSKRPVYTWSMHA